MLGSPSWNSLSAREHAQRQAKHSQTVFHLFLLKVLESVWFFRTSISSVTPFRSVTRY